MTSLSAPETKEMKTNLSILEMDNLQARNFFLSSESYCNIDIPQYFKFDRILLEVYSVLKDEKLKKKSPSVRNNYDVNYSLISNKDGRHAWRPFKLIHPAIYVELVKHITKSNNWAIICDRFTKLHSSERITCLSMPLQSLKDEKDKAAQILHWWLNIEQRSLELAMEYDYIFHADISDCYGSIYTHSIAWALHGKETAKANKKRNQLIGNEIDGLIQDMCQGQTNGIPQGSALMDFIAEMVLGYADLELNKKLEKANLSDYKILRYRDDYRIFVNSPPEGEIILKALTEVLIDLGLKLNSSKTTGAQDVIRNSIKPDKLAWLCTRQGDRNLQKHLFVIHTHGTAYPNAGSLDRALSEYHSRLIKSKPHNIQTPLTMISIAVDIAYTSPRTFPVCAAIISFLLCYIDPEKRYEILCKIYDKFLRLPNIGIMELWLQRIGSFHCFQPEYTEALCHLVSGKKVTLWNTDWIESQGLKKALNPNLIFDKAEFDKIESVISQAEIELFRSRKY